ncbi:unnamed protein product [Urochloa decumbens]|uniref:Uncharacterized protein n=1 Tax=Urochloa decumbens TaxID=240449 RepID=A0ABC9ASW1_9POAL
MGNKDFWCVRVICMIQAARIFNDFAEEQFANFVVQVMYQVYLKGAALTTATNYGASVRHGKNSILYFFARVISVLLVLTVILPCTVIVGMPLLVAGLIYDLGPLACIGVSCWRIVKHDYIKNTESNANLVLALYLFYSLVLCQGVFYCIWKLSGTDCIKNWQVAPLRQQYKFTENGKDWGSASIAAYFSDTKRKCWKDPGSIDGRTMIHYAIDLLGTESWQENLFGARMLDAFIRQGEDLRSLLLPSRPKIQKLIDMLSWRRGPPEIREVAARIVAAVAGDIHLAQFPGAICCISSLLQDETTLIHQHKSKHPHCKGPNQNQNRTVKAYMNILNLFEERLAKLRQQIGRLPEQKEPDGSADNDNGCTAEMILQGLTILEKLASNHHNCSYICNARGLLPKITAPLYSDTLIQDMDISGTWLDLLNRSFKVLHCLICSPGWTGRSLRYEISRNNQAMDNLEMILHLRKGKKKTRDGSGTGQPGSSRTADSSHEDPQRTGVGSVCQAP